MAYAIYTQLTDFFVVCYCKHVALFTFIDDVIVYFTQFPPHFGSFTPILVLFTTGGGADASRFATLAVLI